MPTLDGDYEFTPTHPTYEELQAEVERLTRSCAGWEVDAKRETRNAQFHREWRMKAEAEVERLRAVVRDFHWLYGFFKDRGSVSDAVKTRLDKIDAALSPECRHGGRQQGETPCPDCRAPEVKP